MGVKMRLLNRFGIIIQCVTSHQTLILFLTLLTEMIGYPASGLLLILSSYALLAYPEQAPYLLIPYS
jgi:hypothetical protein